MSYDTYTDEMQRAAICERAARTWTADAIAAACNGATVEAVDGALRIARTYRRIARDARNHAALFARA